MPARPVQKKKTSKKPNAGKAVSRKAAGVAKAVKKRVTKAARAVRRGASNVHETATRARKVGQTVREDMQCTSSSTLSSIRWRPFVR